MCPASRALPIVGTSSSCLACSLRSNVWPVGPSQQLSTIHPIRRTIAGANCTASSFDTHSAASSTYLRLLEPSPILFSDCPAFREEDRGRLQKRSEEHTSELQSLTKLVCRLLPE